MKFAEKLRLLRESKGLSQKELAAHAGLAIQSLSRWENGEQVPPFNAVQSMCVALDVSCNIFDDCEYAEVADKRGRGRPPKADAAPVAKAKPAKRKKKGGA